MDCPDRIIVLLVIKVIGIFDRMVPISNHALSPENVGILAKTCKENMTPLFLRDTKCPSQREFWYRPGDFYFFLSVEAP
jgi:hypothetical protein